MIDVACKITEDDLERAYSTLMSFSTLLRPCLMCCLFWPPETRQVRHIVEYDKSWASVWINCSHKMVPFNFPALWVRTWHSLLVWLIFCCSINYVCFIFVHFLQYSLKLRPMWGNPLCPSPCFRSSIARLVLLNIPPLETASGWRWAYLLLAYILWRGSGISSTLEIK
jgi:hypothetical protein